MGVRCESFYFWAMGASLTSLSYMGSKGQSDPEKLVLTEHLLAAVLAEAKMCCSVEPVMLVCDLYADPSVSPSLAKGAMSATTACGVLPERWFTPHFAFRTDFSITAWDATVEMARVYPPIWPPCWFNVPIVPDSLRLRRCKTFGMSTFKSSALYQGR